jgi:DNA recombination protein RmuC
MMDNFLYLLVLVLGLMAFYFYVKSTSTKGADLDKFKDGINEQFVSLSKEISDKINYHFNVQSSNESRIKSSLDEATRSYKDVEVKLNKLFEVSRQIHEVGKDMSSLNDLLKSPKLRGGLGEFFLEDLLKQVIPKENYVFQYSYPSGEKVDAIIRLAGGKFVPIDSKFPLENYLRLAEADHEERKKFKSAFFKDVKKHIDSISQKYINPEFGSFDFALMYIPAESVYYEIILSDQDNANIVDYFYAKKVIPVSPNNLFVYLQTVLIGLKGFQIEKNAKKIYDLLSSLEKNFVKVGDDFSVLGSHITNARNKYDQTEKNLNRLVDSFHSISNENHLFLDTDLDDKD